MKLFPKKALARAISGVALSVALLSATTFLTPQRAEAQIPVTDIGSLMQMVQDGIMRAMESEIMQTLEQTGLDMMGVFSEMEVDTINNGFSNMIARMGRAMQDIQNMEQEEKSMPAQDVCDTLTLSKSLDDMLCDMDAQVAQFNAEKAGVRAMRGGNGVVVCTPGGQCTVENRAPSAAEVDKYNAAKSKEYVDECMSLVGSDGKSLCWNTSLAVSPPPQGTTAEEYKAVLRMNQAAVGILEKTPRTDSTKESMKGEPLHNKLKALDDREAYFKGSLEASLNLNTIIREGTLEADGTRKMGDLHNLEKYLSTRLGSSNWLCEVTNTCNTVGPNGKPPYVAPAELERRKAEMDAVLLYMNLQQYSSMLRIERTLADLSLMTLDHPKASAR